MPRTTALTGRHEASLPATGGFRGSKRRFRPVDLLLYLLPLGLILMFAGLTLVRTRTTTGRVPGVFATGPGPRYEAAIGPVERPAGVAIGPEGKLYVVDSALGRVVIFNREGSVVGTVGMPAEEDGVARPGRLLNPLGVAVDGRGRVFVSDVDAKRISLFTQSARFDRFFGAEQLIGAPGALLCHEDRLYVADLGRHQVLALNMEGYRVADFGGEGESALRYPNGIAVDRDGTVLIADSGGNRILRFDRDGRFIRVVRSDLPSVRGIAVDAAGRIYAAVALEHRVTVLGNDGTPLQDLVRDSGGDVEFPTGVAVDGDRVIATDRGARGAHVWRWQE